LGEKDNIIAEEIQLKSAENIKTLAFELKSEIENLVLIMGANLNGKAHITVMISDHLVKELPLDARQMIREVSADIQGGGGGQDFYATAGGKNPASLTTAKDALTCKQGARISISAARTESLL